MEMDSRPTPRLGPLFTKWWCGGQVAIIGKENMGYCNWMYKYIYIYCNNALVSHLSFGRSLFFLSPASFEDILEAKSWNNISQGSWSVNLGGPFLCYSPTTESGVGSTWKETLTIIRYAHTIPGFSSSEVWIKVHNQTNCELHEWKVVGFKHRKVLESHGLYTSFSEES